MERLTEKLADGRNVLKENYAYVTNPKHGSFIEGKAVDKLVDYEQAEEDGLLIRLDSKDELIEVLATKLFHSEFGRCYMCTNSMKNITLDGVNNGCDGNCNTYEEFTVDDFLKKIVSEMEYRKRKEAEQALAKMKGV